jgi:hypothetical protein
MIPLLFASYLAASPIVVQPAQAYDPSDWVQVAPKLRTLGPDPTAACAKLSTQTVAPDGLPLRKLGDLPGAIMEHAVWRTIAGCPVREIVYYGQTYYVQGANPRLEEDLRGRVRQY